jgi:hypothetical protein
MGFCGTSKVTALCGLACVGGASALRNSDVAVQEIPTTENHHDRETSFVQPSMPSKASLREFLASMPSRRELVEHTWLLGLNPWYITPEHRCFTHPYRAMKASKQWRKRQRERQRIGPQKIDIFWNAPF